LIERSRGRLPAKCKKGKDTSIYIAALSDRSHIKATVQRQPRVRTMLEWRRFIRQPQGTTNGCQHTQHCSSERWYQFILIGEHRHWHTCVNNLPRVAPSGGTAGNRTRDLSITNPTPHHYTTKPHKGSLLGSLGEPSLLSLGVGKSSTSLLAARRGRVHLCRVAGNPIWQVTPRSSRTSSRRGLFGFNFNLNFER